MVRAMDIALFQPDQPGNTGTLLRLGACMSTSVHIIEPCGFPFSRRALKRYAMDYADLVDLHHHRDFEAFKDFYRSSKQRLILLTTKTKTCYTDFLFQSSDILMVGQESSGVPDYIHDLAHGSVTIPMHTDARSINVAVAHAMVLGEALRQTAQFPK